MNIAALAAPFEPKDIHWRAQAVTKKGDKALALAYLDARDVMDRLDKVCGPANWSTHYEETARGRVLCKLSIRINDEWVTKTDGAGDTAVEGEKGGISDALKRAAVQWGVGRYLYDLANVWAPCEVNEQNKWRKWASGADKVFADALRNLGGPPPTITDEQQVFLTNLAKGAGVPLGTVCEWVSVQNLTEIPASKYERIKGALDKKIEELKQKEAA